jgi:hypothetical protein
MKKNILFVPIILLLHCCKPDESPCVSVVEPTGKFIYNNLVNYRGSIPNEVRYFDLGDTFLCYSNNSGLGYMELTALDTNCIYLWICRGDTFRTKDIILKNLPPNQPIEVSLQVTAKDINNCLSMDKKVKKTMRTFIGKDLPSISSFGYFGKWKGIFSDNTSKEVIIEFKKGGGNSIVSFNKVVSINPRLCSPVEINLNTSIDTIFNIPNEDDYVLWCRDFSAFNSGDCGRKLRFAYCIESNWVKNICDYEPFYYPSFFIMQNNLSEITIVLNKEFPTNSGWQSKYFKTFKGIKI